MVTNINIINKFNIQASSVSGKKHSISTDYVLKVLGLDVCSDTIVGNDMLRGVSGGQRKRVTTGNFLAVKEAQYSNRLCYVFITLKEF